MKLTPLLPDVWRWTWFSQEKGMDFNGYAARLPQGLVLIDPAYSADDDWKELDALGKPAAILLTNKDHERASDELRGRFGAQVWIHEADAPLLNVKPDRTFGDDETLLGALRVVRCKHLKSPGECALLWTERRVLFVGDLVTGNPPGAIGLVMKHKDKPEVLEDVRRLLELDFDALLVGDGQPFLKDGKAAVERFLAATSGK